jgi:hypothetical protein
MPLIAIAWQSALDFAKENVLVDGFCFHGNGF